MAGAMAQSYFTLVLARMGVGALEAPASPGSLSIIGDLFPKKKRATAVSLYYAGTATGQMITFLIGGWLLLHFGWRALFLIAGIPGLFFAAMLFFTCREPKRGRYDDEKEPAEPISYKLAVKSIAASMPLRNAIVANMLATGLNYTALVWAISFLVRIHGMSHEYAAMAVGLGIGFMMMVGSTIAGFAADRYSRGVVSRLARVPAFGCFFAATFGIVMCFMPSLPLALTAMCILSVFMGINTGPGYATLVSLSNPHMRGSILSLAKMISILGNGFFAFMTGELSDMIGGPESIRWAMVITIAIYYLASLQFTITSRSAARAEQQGA